jgi:hypothetical protein
MKNNALLRSRLGQAARRLWLIGSAAAVACGVTAAVAVALGGAWLDLVWELPPPGRIALLWLAAAAGLGLLVGLTWRTAGSSGSARLARRLDLAAESGGAILTGWELDGAIVAGCGRGPLSAGLGLLAVAEAAALARGAPLAKALPLRPLGRALAPLACCLAAVAVLDLAMPGLVRTEWRRFTQPWADVPPYSSLHFVVTPGDAKVLYGGELEIVARVEGGAVDRLELVLAGGDGSPTVLPMFSQSGDTWRAVLSKVTEPAVYHVRSYRARSTKYRIDLITVPQLESVRVQVVPPQYAGQASYVGPVPADGVKGLRGTKVTLWATSNRPLSGGRIAVTAAGSQREKTAAKSASETRSVPMRPLESGGQEVSGQFEIQGGGKFECRVIDSAGVASQQSFSAAVTMLDDQSPLIRILQPESNSLATPTAQVPVVVSAEDDCGIARIEVYRSLNSSRPLPAAVRLPVKWPHRHEEQITLPLAAFGLSPGDVIKLFGRVEDNDPAGSKGSESQVVSLRIIAQEEFDRMVRMRQGIEALTSKYHEAQRRLEALADEADGLRRKLKKLPPASPVAEETRRQMRQLQQLMRQEAEAIRKSAARRLPFDLDQRLSPELGKMARLTDEMADELEKLQKQIDLLNKDADQRLKTLANRLASGRGDYRGTMEAIEHLEAIFPLLVDQQRFTVLVLRQQDLAERMASLRGHDGEDKPALKARMRDLEEEQRQIRLALEELLGDIEDHATRLPDKPELRKLRQTAQRFVKDVRASGASAAMTAAEAALAEFAGTRGHDKAKEADAILQRFLKRCGGMGAGCQGALVFQPTLSRCLGNTVAQLLAAMGFGSGSGAGGYGAMGLYGDMGGMSGQGSGQFGDPGLHGGGRGAYHGGTPAGGANPDVFSAGDLRAVGAATAAGDAAVPVLYRRSVGQYFQRLSEELDDRGRMTPARK